MLVRLRRPSDADLDGLALRLASAEPTYRPADGGRYRAQRWSRELQPSTTWEEATDALRAWRAHRGAGVRIRPAAAPSVGLTVAIAVRVGPAYVLAACRVTDTVETDDACGFRYATLPGHPEEGEERFLLRRGQSSAVTFAVEAVSRHADPLMRVSGPLADALRHRITERYLRLDGLG